MKLWGVIDLETLSARPNAAVIEIGCVQFDAMHTKFIPLREFYTKIDLAEYSSDDHDFHIDGKTLKWWLEQDRVRTFSKTEENMLSAMSNFENWLKNGPIINGWWGNGCSFDNVIIRNWLGSYSGETFFPYASDRDVRTIKMLATDIGCKFDDLASANPHHALEDALYEAKIVHRAYQCIKGSQ